MKVMGAGMRWSRLLNIYRSRGDGVRLGATMLVGGRGLYQLTRSTVVAKRRNGEGTVYQRRDGRWVASARIAGKRVSRYARTEREAFRTLEQLLGPENADAVPRTASATLTLSEWVDQWLLLKSPDLRPSTCLTYRRTLVYPLQTLGSVPLDRLTPLTLTQAFAAARANSGTRRQLHLAHGYLKACLQQAVDFDLIAKNPMDRVPKPRYQPAPETYWTVEQTRRFIATGLREHRYWHPLFVFLVSTGLRISEALGLSWSDVDWVNARVRVERALVWADRQWSMQSPKTRCRNPVGLVAAVGRRGPPAASSASRR